MRVSHHPLSRLAAPENFPPMRLKNKGTTAAKIDRLREQAKGDNTYALATLAYLYRYGHKVAENKRLALQYGIRAASLGDAESAFNVGDMYGSGEGARRNSRRALAYYVIAAKRGGESQVQLKSRWCRSTRV